MYYYIVLSIILLYSVTFSYCTGIITNPTYNLMEFSRLHLERTVSSRASISSDEYCSRSGSNYKCYNRISSNDAEFAMRIQSDQKWDLVFDDKTRGYDIQINFHRTYLVQTFMLTFAEANNISAGSIRITEDSGRVHVKNFASSKLICQIIFDPDYEDCHVANLTSAWKYILPHPIVGRRVVIHLYPPVVNSYHPKPRYTISHLKVYGECYCSSGRRSQCITASEDDIHRNIGQRKVLLCSSDIRYLPFSFYIHKRRRRRDLCECSRAGTLYGICSPIVGLGNQCPCKRSHKGLKCDECSDGYYGYPNCKVCICNSIGSREAKCDAKSGNCLCGKKYAGKKCDKCSPGRYQFPFCYPCPCPTDRTTPSVCDPVSGKCHCKEQYKGVRCTSCQNWLVNYPVCHRPGCKCSNIGSLNGGCNENGQCFCKSKYTGKRCDQCKRGFGEFPICKACQCNNIGSYSDVCDGRTGQCHCKPSFVGKNCDQCKESGLSFPNCEGNQKCECHPQGTKIDLKRNGSCIKGLSCICKDNVESVDCSTCKPNHFNLVSNNSKGCTACGCHSAGSFANLGSCDAKNGQCFCKQAVTGRQCNKCKDGYRSLNMWNLFGCIACNCDIGGSLSPKCDDLGYCQCKENFEGMRCDRLKKGNTYVPDYYHNMYEIEGATMSGKPINYLYNSNEFVNFTGAGYISFRKEQTSIKLLIDVPKTRKYIMIIHYLLRNEEKASVLLYFTSQDRSLSYAASVDFTKTKHGNPQYAMVDLFAKNKNSVLLKGVWELELSARSTDLLLDNVVLIPEEYFTAKYLQPDAVDACLARQSFGSICMDYKYIELKTFQMVQGESGTDSKGYGNDIVKKTRLFRNSEILQQLPVLNGMAELSKNQIALTLQISARKTDSYHLIVTYYNPDDRTYRLDLYDGESGRRGYMEAVPCPYRFMCRAVILNDVENPFTVNYRVNGTSEITFLGNILGTLAIDHVAIVPTNDWSPDYIIPRELCYSKDKKCLQNLAFHTPDDSVPVLPTKANPANPLTNAVYVTLKKAAYFSTDIAKKLNYTLVYGYYQPNYPTFRAKVKILQERVEKSSGESIIPYCPATVHCRGSYTTGELQGKITVKFEIPEGKELWISTVYLVPEASYESEILVPKRTELTQKFRRSCLEFNSLPMRSPPQGFCMQALITLTSEFTSKIYKCTCNKHGSVSTQCAKIGGDCQCKSGVVGKNCDRCRTGYHGFPNCKACNCYAPGSLNPDCDRFGGCKCKPYFTGRKCDQCKKGHWGFPNCQPCNCDRRGSFSLACRGSDGQCPCLRNYAGSKCDRCQIGNYDFPYCRSCNCHSAGIIVNEIAPTGCYRDDPDRCECKPNVEGTGCSRCKDHYYNLTLENPLGCSACNCSPFGTIRGAGPCHRQSGQCICQPNVVGRTCGECKDGYYVVKKDKVFTCQPCLCSAGGSTDDVCNKNTGQCKCKKHVGGLKCDRTADGGYFLPSVGQYIFTVADIVPYARRIKKGRFYGSSVNGSFASMRLKLEITQPEQHFYIMIYYALADKLKPRIDLEFSNKDKIISIREYLKAKSFKNPSMDILKRNSSYFRIVLTEGQWNLQVLFHETIILNQITLVPTEHFGDRKVTKSIHNPCTISDGKRYCSMYTYYDINKDKNIILEGEQFSNDTLRQFDHDTYKGANINGALLLDNEQRLEFSRLIDMQDDFYVVLQYVNINNVSVLVRFTLSTDTESRTGIVEMFPCQYAFACRQVVLVEGSGKVLFTAGNKQRKFTLNVLGQHGIYLDYISLVPRTTWSSNSISPSFYCLRRLSRCIDGTFPSPKNSTYLEAAKALRMITSVPPDSHPATQAVLMTSRRQRNLRWLSPLKNGNFYMIIHYYQPLMDTFLAKAIVMTYQRAVAGKVLFKYCPSIHGCRAVVHYLEGERKQLFTISGNILRASFTLPRQAKIWIERIVLVSPSEFKESVLETSPLDITKRYLRKCIGRPFDQIEKSNKEFCHVATFELTLGLNKYPEKCQCSQHGTISNIHCDSNNGQCPCKVGFRGRDCSNCIRGTYPKCRPKYKSYNFDWWG